MDFQVKTLDESKGIVSVTFRGRLDAACQEEVKAELHQVLDGETSVVAVDMQHVSFIDSSGLSALVSGLRVARENNKDIVLTGLNNQAKMVFNLTMLDQIFSIYPSIDAATDELLAA